MDGRLQLSIKGRDEDAGWWHPRVSSAQVPFPLGNDRLEQGFFPSRKEHPQPNWGSVKGSSLPPPGGV